jgi:adenosylmethionine-8-amino-7-oxononanoate aminotransferase
MARIAEQHIVFVDKISGHSGVLEARQLGTILAVELKDPSGQAYFSNIRDLAYAFFLERGLLIRPCGNVVFLNPPYCISNAQLALAYQAIHDFIETLSPVD